MSCLWNSDANQITQVVLTTSLNLTRQRPKQSIFLDHFIFNDFSTFQKLLITIFYAEIGQEKMAKKITFDDWFFLRKSLCYKEAISIVITIFRVVVDAFTAGTKSPSSISHHDEKRRKKKENKKFKA